MTNREKFWYLVGPVVLSFVFAATSPIIHVYFVSIISPRIFAMAELLGTALSAFVNWSIPKAKMKEWYRKHFVYIVLIDIFCFWCFSFYGLEYPEVRFLGFAALNAVSTCLWVMIMRNVVNRIIIDGDKRTDFDALNECVTLIACFCGGILAIIFIDVPVEYCLALQCFSNAFMGMTDLYAFTRLNKSYNLNS